MSANPVEPANSVETTEPAAEPTNSVETTEPATESTDSVEPANSVGPDLSFMRGLSPQEFRDGFLAKISEYDVEAHEKIRRQTYNGPKGLAHLHHQIRLLELARRAVDTHGIIYAFRFHNPFTKRSFIYGPEPHGKGCW